MKKQILLALTVIMLMCGFVFSANAADCNGYHTMQKVDTVAPTCTTEGYDLYSCVVCGEHHIKTNYTAALGHLGVDVDDEPYKWQEDEGCYYYMRRCERNCGAANKAESEMVSGVEVPIVYYNVQFVNNYYYDVVTDEDIKTLSASDLAQKAKELKANQRDTSVKYAYLVKWQDGVKNRKALQSTYVKKGESVRYRAENPFRHKTVAYGGYKFLGWTKTDADLTTAEISRDTTIKDVQENITYYTAWEPIDVYYSVVFFNSDLQQLTKEQAVLHGQTPSYVFSYPPREESIAYEYKFDGWKIGTATISTDPLDKAIEVYEHIKTENLHISKLPIYSDESIVAVHKELTRQYNYVIYDNEGNILVQAPNIDYGANKKDLIDIKDATAVLDSNDIRSFYEDDKYAYEFTGYWQTENGTRVNLESVRPPVNSIDWDDEIYLKDTNGRYIMDGEEKLQIEDLHEKYRNIFDLNTQNFVAVVDKNGNNILKSDGYQLWLYIDKSGIFISTVNFVATEPFTDDDAQSLRNIKLTPIYNKRTREYPLIIKAVIPNDELVPGDYSGLIVQITDANGQLMASGKTGTVDGNTTSVKLYVKQTEIYRITVVSENGKYIGESRQLWNILKPDKAGKEITINLEVSEGYSSSVNKSCNCICHNAIFRGLWVRVLNLLYRFFNVKYVCCYDMYATLGDLLIYTK